MHFQEWVIPIGDVIVDNLSHVNIAMTLSLSLSLSLPLTDLNLNPVFSLLPLYTGHPTFQVLAETLRNQIFAMPHPPIRRMAQQQLTERECMV